ARAAMRIGSLYNCTATAGCSKKWSSLKVVCHAQVAIQQHGPAVVIVDSSPKSFTLYKAGVLYDERCSKKSAKHAVLAVGWGQEKGEPHFILKNSWSDAWGERGYVRVQARANTCGVLTHPSYPRLEDDDVL
ncbi:jg22875, partial [Pararge aegeria aegeria]